MNLPKDIVDIDEHLNEKIEKILNETNIFNKSNGEMVNLYFFYSINHSLEEYTKVVVPLKLGNLSKDELLTNILKYRLHDGRRFMINGIYSYQFNKDIIEFLKDNECSTKEHNQSQLQDIKFEPIVDLFQHYTSIFILLNNEKTRHTKKMYEPSSFTLGSLSKRKTIKLI